MKTKFQKPIKYILVALAFLMPVFFLPITSEAFEFNKLVLMIALTSASLVLWALQVISEKEIKIAKTRLVTPGLLLTGVIILSSIFSIDKTSSIFGESGKWYPSLISFLTLGAFYLVLTSNIKERADIKSIIYSFFSGATVATLIGILSYYGILFINGTDKNFNPTGSLLTLGVLAVLTIFFAVYELIKNQNMVIKVFAIALFALNLFYITIYNRPLVWLLAAITAIALALVIKPAEIKAQRLPLIALGIILATILGLITMPPTRLLVLRHTYPQEVVLPFTESWNISVSTMRDFPIVGTGPSTFYLNYPRYRSVSMNQTDLWDFRFDKPFSEALLTIGSLGILGILAGAYFTLKILKVTASALRPEKEDLIKALAVLTLIMTIILFVTHGTVLLGFTMTLILGLLGAGINLEENKYLTLKTNGALSTTSLINGNATDENSGFITAMAALPLFLLAGLGFFTLYKMYPSEYYMQKAIAVINENAGQSYDYQSKAIKYNPRRSNYYNTYAQTNLAIAINLSGKENLTQQEQETIQSLVATAIRASKISTETLNPLNPANWEVQAGIYKAIRGAATDADDWALRALDSATQLDPNNPRLRLDIGGIYYAKEDYLSAAYYFRQAINLKPDYANAYYNFAQAAVKAEDYAGAKRALELTLSLIPQNSEDFALVEKEIEEVNAKLALLSAEEQKPTVEELSNKGKVEESGITEQEPLSVEGEAKESVNPTTEAVEGAKTENTEGTTKTNTEPEAITK